MIIKIVTIAALLYLAWGLFHHKRDKSLTLEVFIEYLLITVLVLVILAGVLIS